jgi:hypothetical protein
MKLKLAVALSGMFIYGAFAQETVLTVDHKAPSQVITNDMLPGVYALECVPGPDSNKKLLGAINGLAKVDELSRAFQAGGKSQEEITKFRLAQFARMTDETGCKFKFSSVGATEQPKKQPQQKGGYDLDNGNNSEHERL